MKTNAVYKIAKNVFEKYTHAVTNSSASCNRCFG